MYELVNDISEATTSNFRVALKDWISWKKQLHYTREKQVMHLTLWPSNTSDVQWAEHTGKENRNIDMGERKSRWRKWGHTDSNDTYKEEQPETVGIGTEESHNSTVVNPWKVLSFLSGSEETLLWHSQDKAMLPTPTVWMEPKLKCISNELVHVLRSGRDSSSFHMVGHPRCVFINYIWLNQLSQLIN